MPRTPVTAPKGYLTIAEAAERAEVSPATVRRAVDAGDVRHRREGWSIFVDERDVDEIELKTRGQEGADRVAVMLRPVRDRHAAWARAAGKRAVSDWLGELADRSAKWRG